MTIPRPDTLACFLTFPASQKRKADAKEGVGTHIPSVIPLGYRFNRGLAWHDFVPMHRIPPITSYLKKNTQVQNIKLCWGSLDQLLVNASALSDARFLEGAKLGAVVEKTKALRTEWKARTSCSMGRAWTARKTPATGEVFSLYGTYLTSPVIVVEW
jgi:hypothetical protein